MKIKNWRRFQHYKHRNPAWVKLYGELLDDPQWFRLSGDASKVLVGCWLIARKHNGELPETRILAFQLRISEKDLIAILSQLNHWLEQDASLPLAGCMQSATTETESESKKESKRVRLRIPRTLLPEDWMPTELDDKDLALLEDFRDYWIGEGKPKADWNRTWKRWKRRQPEFAPRAQAQQNQAARWKAEGKSEFTGIPQRRTSNGLDTRPEPLSERKLAGGSLATETRGPNDPARPMATRPLGEHVRAFGQLPLSDDDGANKKG